MKKSADKAFVTTIEMSAKDCALLFSLLLLLAVNAGKQVLLFISYLHGISLTFTHTYLPACTSNEECQTSMDVPTAFLT